MMIDGGFTDMPADFPKIEIKGSKNLFVFRIPRFSDKALIDPLVSLGAEEPTLTPFPTPTPTFTSIPTPTPTSTAPPTSTLTPTPIISINGGGITTKVLRQSGKITVTGQGIELTFEVDSIAEVDQSGNKVGKAGA